MAAEPLTLDELLRALAADEGQVAEVDEEGARSYSRSGTLFAVVDQHGVELRLHPAVAEAAAQTPDTRLSDRGPGWVHFTPAALDGHARDRARAWFLSAWRAAGDQR